MLRTFYSLLFVTVFLSASLPARSVDSGGQMLIDNEHVKAWNTFSQQILELHKKQIEGKRIKETAVFGGYRDNPDFYREVTYTDKDTDRVISIIQWETDNPDVVHSIEVYVYNSEGKLIRDYSAAYLPEQRNAPVQTLINLHHYNGGLHAFRQFDVSTDVIYEYCNGEYNGQQQELRLFEDDLAATDYDARQLLKSPLYKACFSGLPTHLGKYINPQ